MRVNVYAEEMTDRVEIISKEIDGHTFTGLRFYLELPATVGGQQYQAPFMHRPGDDDSSAVTFWGKRDLREVLALAQSRLDAHYGQALAEPVRAEGEREAFEAWVSSKPSRREKLPLDKWDGPGQNGGYRDPRTYQVYYGWLSGRAIAAPAGQGPEARP